MISYLFLQKRYDLKAVRHVWFPICHSESDFLNDGVDPFRLLVDVFGPRTTNFFTALAESQPYKRKPEAPKEDVLWILRELDNIDKHRTVLVLDNRTTVTGTAFSEDEVYSNRFVFRKQPVKAGTEVFNFDWPHPVPPTKVQMDDMSDFIVFDKTDGLCDGKSVFPMFRKMVATVNDTIDRFFSP